MRPIKSDLYTTKETYIQNKRDLYTKKETYIDSKRPIKKDKYMTFTGGSTNET